MLYFSLWDFSGKCRTFLPLFWLFIWWLYLLFTLQNKVLSQDELIKSKELIEFKVVSSICNIKILHIGWGCDHIKAQLSEKVHTARITWHCGKNYLSQWLLLHLFHCEYFYTLTALGCKTFTFNWVLVCSGADIYRFTYSSVFTELSDSVWWSCEGS